jgi:hypothetical protein
MNRILAITTALALGGIGLTAIASPYERGPHGYDTNTRVERMAEHLNLTNEQQEKIKAMFDAHKKERQARRENMHEEISDIVRRNALTEWQNMTANTVTILNEVTGTGHLLINYRYNPGAASASPGFSVHQPQSP